MPRTIQPELLDTLPPEDPDALHSRRDLRVINTFMGNHRWLVRTLKKNVRGDERILEIGAGTGELARRLRRAGLAAEGLDLLPPPLDWPDSSGWHSADLKTFDRYAEFPVIIGNLIFHHLEDTELLELGTSIRPGARLILACEPARSRLSQLVFRTFSPMFAPSHVTVHDAHVSIAGGFTGNELPVALGLSQNDWIVKRSVSLFGGYRMMATRRA
ncbi:MAG TPA: methyltransferase domain-containing protein [Opitutus sp.]|nr:methyltransferase domain-containing protein [Opitutus sp.]